MSYDIYDLNNILNEMRTYNPKADEHDGKHIIPGWADRIEKALSNQKPVGFIPDNALKDLKNGFAASVSPKKHDEYHPLYANPSPSIPAVWRQMRKVILYGDKS
ncbi:hypothetical protein PUATCC27989T_00458 [Phytobacter ursingii]|nr:hypothetical protein PUATCC27989T_00458 [Phytobacter ursingii]